MILLLDLVLGIALEDLFPSGRKNQNCFRSVGRTKVRPTTK